MSDMPSIPLWVIPTMGSLSYILMYVLFGFLDYKDRFASRSKYLKITAFSPLLVVVGLAIPDAGEVAKLGRVIALGAAVGYLSFIVRLYFLWFMLPAAGKGRP